MAEIQNVDNTDAGEAVDQQNRSLVAGGLAKWCSDWGRAWPFLTKLEEIYHMI